MPVFIHSLHSSTFRFHRTLATDLYLSSDSHLRWNSRFLTHYRGWFYWWRGWEYQTAPRTARSCRGIIIFFFFAFSDTNKSDIRFMFDKLRQSQARLNVYYSNTKKNSRLVTRIIAWQISVEFIDRDTVSQYTGYRIIAM